jgi:catechol 2,3-dioxygenase-like lactoylglutathione lyase family enzyme
VTIRVSDRAAAEPLYRAALATLGIEPTHAGEWYVEWDDFSLSQATDDKPGTRGLHIAFRAPSREHVDAFWRGGLDAGLRDDGEPGPRPQYRLDYYGSFLRDPDGNSVEAVHHGAMRAGGWIDHMWIRVADVDASRRFYERVAPIAGLHVNEVGEDRVMVRGSSGSFSLVPEQLVTENVHIAFPAPDNATVDEFHRVLTGTGYRDNGAPGERAIYHEGYYGAFVLDPDGNNVELVNHNR